MAETFNVTQTTTLFTDVDGDGQIDPGPVGTGDTVSTSVTITNNSTTTNATNIDFNEGPLNGMTLVAGSVTVTPIAFDDSGYSLSGNTPKLFTASVLANDLDPDGPEASLIAVNATNVQNGTVVLNTDGTFTFTPATGYEGPASFEYTVRDAQTLDSVTTGKVTLTVTDCVWYVDSAYTGANGASDGSYLKPYVTLAPLNDTTPTVAPFTDPDGTNDTIFIYNNGTTYTGGIVLEDGQTLHGDGQALTVNGLSIGVSASDAVLSNVGGTIVTLGVGNTLTGLTLQNSDTDISGTSFGTLTVTNVDLTGTGRLVNLSNGTANATFDVATTTGTGASMDGITLTSVDGNLVFGSTPGSASITGTDGTENAVDILGGTASVDFNGAITHTNNAQAITIANKTGGTVSFDGNVSSNTSSDGISLTNNAGTTFGFTGTLAINTSASNTTAFNASNSGTLTATGSGSTINSGTATALNISNTNIGAADVTFQSISSSGGSATGIILDNTGSAGGLHIIGTGGAGSGGTIANKTGADGSTSTGVGIYLNNTAEVQLDRMQLNGFDNFAIRASDVNGLTLQNSVINGNNGNSAAADEGAVFIANSSGTINLTNLQISGGFEDDLRVLYDSATADTATYNITGSTFSDLQSGNNALVNLRSTTTASTASNVTFNIGSSSTPALGNTFDNSANQNPLPPPETQWFGDGILVTFEGGFQHNINIDNNTFNELFQAIDFAANFSADVNARIYSNDITFTEGVGAIAFGTGSSSTSSMLFQMLIEDNNIGTVAGGNDSGSRLGLGIVGDFRGAETDRVTIHQNVILNTEVNGIQIISQATVGDGDVHLRVTNNTVDSIDDDEGGGAGVIYGIEVTTNAGTNGDIFADIRGNDSDNVNAFDIRVRQATANNTFALEDFAGNGTVAAQVEAFLATQNPASTTNVRTGGSVVNYTSQNLNNTDTPAPLTPLLAAEGGVEAAPPDSGSSPADGTPTADNTPPADTTPPADSTPPANTTLPAPDSIATQLTQAQLDGIVDAAIARWEASGLTAEQSAYLQQVTFSVGDMAGAYLGVASAGHITIDTDAAGYGWFIDSTPSDDAEFGNGSGTRLFTDSTGTPAGHFDLLTTVMHELGHQLGIEDGYTLADRDELMFGYLVTGERRLPGEDDADGAVAGSIVSEEFLGTSTAHIDTLPFGKAVRITWQATIDEQRDKFITNPTNSGTVTANAPFPGSTTVGPETVTLDSLTLSGHIYNDADKDGYEAGEGIAGVRVSLFVDTNHDGDFDLGTDLLITGGTDFRITDANGLYTFAGLAPGDYILRVDQDNFVNSGGGDTLTAMVPYQVSVLTSPEPIDPDNNVDNDDNGARVQGAAAYTRAINLEFNQEPDGTPDIDGDLDADTNFTLDLGFFANTPPTVSPVSGSGAEDQPARVQITLSGTDADLDTIVHFTIATVPANGQLWTAVSGGTQLNAGDTVAATGPTPFTANVFFQPTADWSGSTGFNYTAFDGAENSTTAATASITITATPDVSVTAPDRTAAETDAAVNIPLNLTTLITDVDASETLTNVVVTFTGAPTLTIPAGTGTLVDNGGGSYTLTLTAAQVAGASINVPADYSDPVGGPFSGSAVANSNEGASAPDLFTVSVSATAEPVTANDVGGTETDATVTIPLALSVAADDDGSETLTNVVVTFTGAPSGMTATGGTLVGNVLTIPAANVGTVSITVPADFAGSFTGSAVANSNEGSSAADGFTVNVTASGDVSVTANDTAPATETDATVTIALSLSTVVDDVDASETLTNVVVTFTGAPAGMTATGGTLVGNVLTIPAANVGTASITVPADYAGTFSGSAVANTNEGASAPDTFNVTVNATPEAITANDVGGTETDATVNIPLALSVHADADGSETLTNVVVTFTGAPAGMTATGGTLVGNVLTIPAANVGTVSITVPADFAGSFTGSAVANSNEGASAPDTFNVNVTASGDVSVTANDVGGTETNATVTIGLSLSTVVDDADASETLTNVVVTFTGAPAGMTATGGTLVGNVLTIPAANVSTASITVPADFAGSFTGSAVANTNEGASAADGFTVNVTATGDVSLTANDVSGTETDATVTIPLSLSAPITDADGSETLTDVVITFTGAPAGMTATGGTLVANVLTIPGANVGTASITVPAEYSGSFTASAVAHTNEGTSNIDGFTVNVTATGDVSVTANDVNGVETNAPVTIALSLSTLVNDGDASETLTNVVVTFTGAPAGMTAATGVLVDNTGGSYTLTLSPAQVAGASITVPANFFGDFTGSAVANTNEGASTADGFTVHVAEVNDQPQPVNDPLSSVAEDSGTRIIQFTDVTGNDSPGPFESGQTLTVSLTAGQIAGAVGGTVGIVAGHIEFTPTANFNGTASFDYTVTDNGTTNGVSAPLSGTAQVSFQVTAVNDAPTATAPVAHYSATEQNGLNIKNSGLSVADVDAGGGNLTVTLSVGQGILNVTAGTSGANVTNSGSSSVTITGTAAQINNLLNANATSTVVYTANLDNPGSSTTLTLAVDDNGNTGGPAQTGSASAIIDITPVNDAPSAVITPLSYNATEQVALDLKNNGLSVDDIDGNLGNETVTLSVVEGTLTVTAGGSGAIVSNSGTSSVTIQGTAAQIKALLTTDATSTVSYINNSNAPSASTTLSLTIHDNGSTGGGDLFVSDSATINIAPVNDAPALNNAVNASYTENSAPVTLSSGIVVSDVDGNSILGGTVTIGSGFVTGDQLLVFDPISGFSLEEGDFSGTAIHYSYDDTTHVLTLSGADTNANYTEVLSHVQFLSFGENPTDTGNSLTRTITWTITDNGSPNLASPAIATTVNVTAVDDAPVNTVPGTQNARTDTDHTIEGLSVSDPDSGAAPITVTLVVQHGTLRVRDDVTGGLNAGAITGNNTDTVTLHGGQALINATLAASTGVVYRGDFNYAGPDTLTMASDDGDFTGPGGPLQDLDSIAINVTERHHSMTDFNPDSSDVLWQRVGDGALLDFDLNGPNLASFGFPASVASEWQIASAADYNGDQNTDLLFRRDDGGLLMQTFVNNQLQSETNIGQMGSEWQVLGSSDFNGDTRDDILWRNDGDGTLLIFDMNGPQITATPTVGQIGSEWHLQGTGDYNGDGTGDMFWRAGNGSLLMFEINNNQVQKATVFGQMGNEWQVAGSGDFNGDDKTDILWQRNDGALLIFDMNGAQIQSVVNAGQIGPEWDLEGTADYNNDGTADLLWQHDNGSLLLFEMANNQVNHATVFGQVGTEWHLL